MVVGAPSVVDKGEEVEDEVGLEAELLVKDVLGVVASVEAIDGLLDDIEGFRTVEAVAGDEDLDEAVHGGSG